MRKFVVLIVMVLLVGCSGFQIEETPTHQAMAYVSGKAMAIGINELYPEVDPDLTRAWEGMIERNKGQDMVSSGQMMLFYNESIGIIGLHTNDPYGLIGDLGALLLIFGAQFSAEGEMLVIDPVPMSVLNFFGVGYANGRRVALREK